MNDTRPSISKLQNDVDWCKDVDRRKILETKMTHANSQVTSIVIMEINEYTVNFNSV